MLKDNRPARKRGGDRKSEDAKIKCDNGTIDKRPHGSNTRLYIEERLKRDHPKVWKDYYALLRTCTCGKLLFKGISSVWFADVFNYAHAKV